MSGESPNVLRMVRWRHEERVLTALRAHGASSRADLGTHTGLSRATLYEIVRHLISTGALVEHNGGNTGRKTRGRPASMVALNPASGLALGLDFGHRRVHASVANVAHEIVADGSRRYPERASWTRRVALGLELVEQLAEERHITLASLDGVGAGVVGPVAGASTSPRQRRGRTELVRDELAARFGVPVRVDNNTRLAALAESIWGSGAAISNVLYLRLSHGVGGGLVIDGHLHFGAAGAAGELGHVSVEPDGVPCDCGGRGCLERYVALPVVLNQAGAADLDDLKARLQRGTGQTVDAVRTAGERIGRVLAAACNVINPQCVILGGELAEIGEPLSTPVRTALREHAHRQVRQGLTVRHARLGDEGAARGGVALVLRRSVLLAGYPMAEGTDPAATEESSPSSQLPS